MKKYNLFKCFLAIFTLVACLFSSCKDELENTVYRTSDIKMIDEYMETPENNLSQFLAIVDKSDYRGMLHAYGTYTCFIPTNNAVEKYMKAIGKTIDQLSTEEAAEIVSYHVVNDTIASQDFVDGRLSAPNIAHQYITTRTKADAGGNIFIEIDRKAHIVTKDILLGNGYIHTVDVMLGKATKSLAEQIDELPDRFSFMKDLFKETEIYKELSTMKTDSSYYSVFVQDNQTFIDEGIETQDKLLDRLKKNTPEVTSEKELIENFVGYHVITGRKYVVDLMLASALSTVISPQVLSFSMEKDKLYINRYKIGKLNEEGILLDRESELTDLSCYNGVMHEVKGTLEIKKRPAYRVNFDLAEQPEIKALKTYRKTGAPAVTFAKGTLSEMTWDGKNNPTVKYYCSTNYDAKGQYIYGDNLEFRICTNVMQWCELKLPLLVEGTYKVWLCWRRVNPCTFRTTFKQEGQEDQVLPTVVDMSGYMPIIYADKSKNLADHDLMEQTGWKQYTAREVNSVMNSRLMGTIKVTSTGRHILRFDALSASKGSGNPWDMIQFIPIDESQIWPMIDMMGNLIEEGTPGAEIYPNKPYSWE